MPPQSTEDESTEWAANLKTLINTVAEPNPKARKVNTRAQSNTSANLADKPVTTEFLTEALSKQLESLKSWFVPIISPIIDKVDEHDLAINDVRLRLQSLEDKIDNLKSVPKVCDKELDLLKSQVAEQQKLVKDLKTQTKDAPSGVVFRKIREQYQRDEDKRRSHNIVIHGIEVTEEEASEGCERKAENLFQIQLGIKDPIPMNAAFRLGTSEKAPILVKLKDIRDKGRIFAHCSKLKDVTPRISIQEDLSEDTRHERRRQLDDYKRLKLEGRNPIFRGPRIFVDGKPWMQR